MIQNSESYFPLFILLKDKKIVIYGGGKIAARRIFTLLEFDADIKVIAPRCTEEIIELAKQKKLVIEERSYQSGEIEKPYMVMAITNNRQVNEAIYMECKGKGILVNVASDQSRCDFFFPGIVKEDSLVIGVTSSGKDYNRTKQVTEQIRNMVTNRKERIDENSYRE